ncbi:MAG: ABC transporter ATP-binding protein [bacterium]|nr:ABC transporter ATP-binding protein [bacterium]
MVSVTLNQIKLSIADKLILNDINLKIDAGELFFLLGPSGCGKTTLLRLLAGFYQPDTGDIYFNDQRVNEFPPYQRNIGFVFQNYALFPHLTVAKNIEYGLRTRNIPIADRKKKVAEILALVKLSGYEKRSPGTLSGGEQQRVAVARALVISPDLLLLDEPLANLDAKLRIEMREEIRAIHRESGVTTIYVTHDCKEALSLADRIAVMRDGRILQVGTPKEIYYQPVNSFVAGFIGETNLINGTIQQILEHNQILIQTELGQLIANQGSIPVQPGQSVICSIRPESIQLQKYQASSTEYEHSPMNRFSADIVSASFQGEQEQIWFHLATGLEWKAVVTEAKAVSVKPGEKINISFPPEHIIVLKE